MNNHLIVPYRFLYFFVLIENLTTSLTFNIAPP